MAIHILRTAQDVEATLPVLMSRPVWGFDTETTGLDPHTDRVTLMQVGNEQDQYVVDTRKVDIRPWMPFFANGSIRKIGHHSKFDYKMTKSTHGIEVEGLRDTMLADKIYHNGRKDKGFSLDAVAKAWIDVDIDKSLQKSFIGHVGDYSEQQLAYAAMDVRWLCPLAQKQANYLNMDGQLETWQMESDCTSCYGDMELNGVKLDVPRWRGIMERNIEEAEKLRREMDKYPAQFPHHFRTDLFGNVEINYDSPIQILHLLQAMGIKVKDIVQGKEVTHLIADTNDKTLQKVAQYPVVKALQDYRGYTKQISTYGQNFIDAIHPRTGRIHPEFDQIGAETGRPTSHSKSPVNMLNIPRNKEMRNSFIADEGCKILTYDYSGCELRIWAYLSQDPFLMEAFRNGIDVHCHVASKLYRVEVTKKNENKRLRTPTKTLNFGIAYGMGPLRLYFELNGQGFVITLDESKALFRNYEKELHVGVGWIRNVGRQAAEQGYLQLMSGRRRYWRKPNPDDRATFPEGARDRLYQGVLAAIGREGGNYPMQGTNADMTKRAMISLRRWSKQRGIEVKLLNNVYDELVTQCKEEYADEVAEAKQKIMKDEAAWFLSGREGLQDVPMEVEGHILPYWTKE